MSFWNRLTFRRNVDTKRWGSWLQGVLAGIGIVALVVLALLAANPTARSRAAILLTRSEPAASKPATITHAVVRRVLDGTTAELDDGQVVRYLGIRAPALGSGSNGTAEFYGPESREANRALVEGKQVSLEADGKDRDAEGHLLRYVWVDQTFVNVALARGGYARAEGNLANLKYGALLQSIEEEARQSGVGIWSQEAASTPVPQILTTRTLPTPVATDKETATPFGCAASAPDALPAGETLQHVGERRPVAFQVVRTHNSGRAVFLNSADPYEGHFYVVIFPDQWDQFPDPPETYFNGRCVVVEGKIGLYRGAPQIILQDRQQIQIIR